MEKRQPSQPALAYVCHEFPKLTETFVYREIAGLRELGRKVKVLAMKRPTMPEQIEGVEDLLSMTRYFPSDFGLEFLFAQAKWILKKPATYFGELFSVMTAGEKRTRASLKTRVGFFLRGVVLASMLDAEPGFALMHDPGTGHQSISVHAAYLLAGIPYGFTVHAPLELYTSSPLLARHARDARWIACISKDARDRLVALAGKHIKQKSDIVHCGVRVEDYVRAGKKTGGKVLSVGSLIDRKGHDLAVRAVASLVEKGMDVSLDIAGEGPRYEQLASMANELGVNGRVRLLGPCHPRRVRELLSEAEVFVQPCRVDSKGARDGIPVALMEAMAMELPVVSTTVSGIPELIEDGVSGLLVEPDDPDALASAIGRLLRDGEFAETLGKAGRKKIEEQFTLEKQVKVLDNLIERFAIQ